MDALTPVDRRTLAALRRLHSEHGLSPTVRELAIAAGLSGVSVAQYHLERLISAGAAVRLRGGSASRAIVPAQPLQTPSLVSPKRATVADRLEALCRGRAAVPVGELLALVAELRS